MIRIEITLGRGAAAPARLAASGLAQASVTSSAPLPAAGPPAGVPRRSRQPAWQPVLASAAAALMFSFVATPDSPYAAAIDAATRAPVVAGSASAAASVAACAIPALAAPVPVAPLSTAVLADADAGLAMGEPLRADELDDAGRPSAAAARMARPIHHLDRAWRHPCRRRER